MQVILAYVQSLDGFLTDHKGRPSSEWASPEDWNQFKSLTRECGLVIFGSSTYETIRETLQLDPAIVRVVMTKNPEKYSSEARKGMLDFSSLSPKELLQKLEHAGHSKALLAGGPRLYRSFFEEGLISEVRITIEPILFGGGIASSEGIPAKIDLKLIDTNCLNQRGTLLVWYKVL